MRDAIYRSLSKQDEEEMENERIWKLVDVVYTLVSEKQDITKTIDFLIENDKDFLELLIQRQEKIDERIFKIIKEGV
jgi:hypothetical protein